MTKIHCKHFRSSFPTRNVTNEIVITKVTLGREVSDS